VHTQVAALASIAAADLEMLVEITGELLDQIDGLGLTQLRLDGL
jgi:hypothetical protein